MIDYKSMILNKSIDQKLISNNISKFQYHKKNLLKIDKRLNNKHNKLLYKNMGISKSQVKKLQIITTEIFNNKGILGLLSYFNQKMQSKSNKLLFQKKIKRIYNSLQNKKRFIFNKNKKNYLYTRLLYSYILSNINTSPTSIKQIFNTRINSFINKVSKKYRNICLTDLPIDLMMLDILNKKQDAYTNFKNKQKNASNVFFLQSFSKFYSDIRNNQFLIYNFNKANKFNSYPFKKVFRLLTLAFLSMGCFISKPNIQILYKPSINNQISTSNKNTRFNKSLPISDLINYWSKNQIPDLTSPIPLNNKLNYHKKINIQLFYYVRSENPIISHLKKLAYRFQNIIKLRSQIFISNPDKYQDRIKLVIAQLSKIKYDIRKEQKKIIKLNILRKYTNIFKHLGTYLGKLFNAEIQLELIRLRKPYNNSNILVQNLSVESYHTRFVRLVSKLVRNISFLKNLSLKKRYDQLNKFNYNYIPLSDQNESYLKLNTVQQAHNLSIFKNNYSFSSYLTGMNIRLGGRTFKQRILPRMTQKRIQKCSLNKSKVLFFDRARFSNKTIKGAYTFTIKMGHVFY